MEPDGGPEEAIAIPLSAFQLLSDILTEMGTGIAVTLIPVYAEPTTQPAADILNVSRPFLVEQLEQGTIPSARSERIVGISFRIRSHTNGRWMKTA